MDQLFIEQRLADQLAIIFFSSMTLKLLTPVNMTLSPDAVEFCIPLEKTVYKIEYKSTVRFFTSFASKRNHPLFLDELISNSIKFIIRNYK